MLSANLFTSSHVVIFEDLSITTLHAVTRGAKPANSQHSHHAVEEARFVMHTYEDANDAGAQKSQ